MTDRRITHFNDNASKKDVFIAWLEGYMDATWVEGYMGATDKNEEILEKVLTKAKELL